MMRRRNGEPAGNGHHHPNSSAGADGFGPDAALMGFHGTNACSTSSPSRTSDGGFSAVSGGPLHLASRGTASTSNGGMRFGAAAGNAHQPNKLYVSSPAPGVGLSGSGYRGGGGGGLVEEMGDRTPLFGAPPAGAGFDARYARHGNGNGSSSGGSSVSALHSARSRDRRRMMGRLAVRATQPAALMLLAGVALVMMMTTTSWSGGGAVTTGTPAAGATGKVLAATAATASGGAAEMLAEAAVDVLSQAAAFGSTGGTGAADGAGTSSHGNIKVVQPENLGSAAAGSAEVAAPAAAAAEAAPLSATASTDATATVTLSAANTSVDSPAKGDAGVLWLLDKDGNKKVILIPRDSDKKKAASSTSTAGSTQAATKLQQKQSLLQKLGLARRKDHKKQQKQQQQQAAEAASTPSAATDAASASDVVTYYYDSVVPQTAMTSTAAASTAASTSTGPGQEAPMAAVPEVVYDKMGNAVKLVDLHHVGAAAASPSTAEESSPVLASPADDAINAVANALPSNANAAAKVPKTPLPTAKSSAAEVTGAALTSPATAAVAATKSMANSLAGASSLEAEGTTNQLIVIATVATMALFGGALVARRMRTRNFLNSCIENESLEDELAYDAANTTLGAAVGYDTFSAVGDMKWKGDLEKFDV